MKNKVSQSYHVRDLSALKEIKMPTNYTFGIFLTLAIFFASFIIWRKAKGLGYAEDRILDLILVCVLSGIISAHIFKVFLIGPFSIGELLSIWRGSGLYYGALIGGFISFRYMCNKFGWSIFEVGDIAVSALSLGQAVGSIGYLLGGFQNSIAALESIYYFLSFFALEYIPLKRKYFGGFLFYLYLISFSIFRFIVEFLRPNSLRVNFIFSIALLTISVLGFYLRRKNYLFKEISQVHRKDRLDITMEKRVVRTWRELAMREKLPVSFINKVKNRLLRQKAGIKQEELLLKQQDPFTQEDRVEDSAERVSDTEEQIGHERVTVIKNLLKKSTSAVTLALSKIKRGRYGICESCGKVIDKARLEVNPTAQFCIECARQKETTSPPKDIPPTKRVS